MTPEQAREYRTVEFFKVVVGVDPITETAPLQQHIVKVVGYFHRWVNIQYLHEDPRSGNKFSLSENMALIEHEDGTLGYYKPDQFRFTDR